MHEIESGPAERMLPGDLAESGCVPCLCCRRMGKGADRETCTWSRLHTWAVQVTNILNNQPTKEKIMQKWQSRITDGVAVEAGAACPVATVYVPDRLVRDAAGKIVGASGRVADCLDRRWQHTTGFFGRTGFAPAENQTENRIPGWILVANHAVRKACQGGGTQR